MTSNDQTHPSTAADSTYPFATAPDIIRAHQKDAYFRAQLLTQLSTLLRPYLGTRILHSWSNELSTFADTLYLSLTTLLGNRTLGEEYCDLIQVTRAGKLPRIGERAGYISGAILLPYILNRLLPGMRSAARGVLTARLAETTPSSGSKERAGLRYRVLNYVLTHLNTILSTSPLQAATLTIFYFTGRYYQLSKMVVGLRYIFPRAMSTTQSRVGYEVLGVLLVLQIAVQSYLHLSSLGAGAEAPELLNGESVAGTAALVGGGAEVSLDAQSYASNTELLFASPVGRSDADAVERNTHTEVLGRPRYGLSDGATMGWIGAQGRKCTLCLEELKDPSVVACGHVFCWECIWDWVREKAECPLCRRNILGQHILPLRS